MYAGDVTIPLSGAAVRLRAGSGVVVTVVLVLSAKRLEQQADIVLHPDVAEFGLLAWERLDEIIEAGYRYAMKELPVHEDKLKSVL